MTPDIADLDADVRRAEPELWLSSRLAAPGPHTALVALYAVNAELAKVAQAATTPLAGEIRLAWWWEEVEALFDSSRALGHPALQALRGASGLERTALEAMIEARHAELDPRPFADEAQLLAYLDGVDGALLTAAASLLAPGCRFPLVETGRAWGWARLLRRRPIWRGAGRDWTPAAWGETDDREIAAHVLHRIQDALAGAREETRALPVEAFPAVAHVGLARAYAEGRAPGVLEMRARIVWAAISGRL
jgi:phytoene synthase